MIGMALLRAFASQTTFAIIAGMLRRGVSAAAVVLLITTAAHADITERPAGTPCSAPLRPAEPINDAEWHRFLESVDTFRACIEATKSEHEAAAAAHSASARRAVDQWNLFVRTNLNVPEDFPHEASR